MRKLQTGLLLAAASCLAIAAASLLRAADPPVKSATIEAPAGAPQGVICPTPITVDDVRPHIEYLASPELRGRKGEDALVAAGYIRAQFQEAGLKPLFQDGEYFQPIPGVLGDDPATRIIGRNVGGWIEGSDPDLEDEIIILSAHYDHLGVKDGRMYTGADDNASGTAMLLETARQVAKLETRPRRSIAFVAFDLEEHLLWGSRWFAAHAPWELEQVKLFITADMIGRSLGDLPLPTVFVLGSEHGARLREMLGDVGTPQGLEVARLGIDLIGTRSDYGPFRDEKVPFLFFSTGEHPDYHTSRDTADRIDYDKAARVSNLILAVARHAADVDEPPQWVEKPETDIGEAETVHRITQLLLDSDQSGEIKLGGVQKFFVSQVNLQMQGILERGVLTKAERETLAKAAQTLLMSVF